MTGTSSSASPNSRATASASKPIIGVEPRPSEPDYLTLDRIVVVQLLRDRIVLTLAWHLPVTRRILAGACYL